MGGSWLDHGHGDGESLVPVTGVPARDVVAPDRRSASWDSKSSKAVVAALAAVALFGSAGTAYAIRETLFPNFGTPTSPSVWENPRPADASAEVTVAAVTTSTSTVPPTTSVPADTLPAPTSVTSVDDQTQPVDSQAAQLQPSSGTSDRRGSVSNAIVPAIDDSGSDENSDTTVSVSNTGPSTPESEVPTTDGSGSGSSGSGSGGDSDNSGSGSSGGDNLFDDEPDEPETSVTAVEDRPDADD